MKIDKWNKTYFSMITFMVIIKQETVLTIYINHSQCIVSDEIPYQKDMAEKDTLLHIYCWT